MIFASEVSSAARLGGLGRGQSRLLSEAKPPSGARGSGGAPARASSKANVRRGIEPKKAGIREG